MKPITLRLDVETLEALDTEAEERGVSRSEYVRNLLDARSEYGEYAPNTAANTKIDELVADLRRARAERDEYAEEADRLRDRVDDLRDVRETRDALKSDLQDVRAERDELRDRIADIERDLDRVRREKRLILEERDEKAELVEYVERERSAEQRWRQASLATKLKWTVFGAPGDEDGKP
jgi:uncharacterized coiled-coil DUF342 family protein